MTWYRFGEWILRRRFVVLAIVGALTAFFGYYTSQTMLVTSFGELLPQNHPFIRIAHKYDQYFGSVNNVTIMIEAKEGTIYNTEIVKKIVQMTRDMDLVYGIQHGSVRSVASASYFRPLAGGVILNTPILPGGEIPKTESQLEELKSNVHKNPGVIFGRFVSLDDKAAVIEGSFLESRLDYRRIFNEIYKIVVDPERDPSVHIYVGGQPVLYGWVYHYTPQFFWIFVVTALAVWILLYLYFQDWRGALRPTISGVICAIWGLGFIRLLGFGLDPLVLVIPFLITARAVSHSVQMHDRYYEEYYRLRDKEKAILSSFSELFVPSLSGILTDAFGVLVILLVPVLFLQKLAITASFWIAAIIVSELLLNPIVYYYLAPPHIEVIERRDRGLFKRLLMSLAGPMLERPGRIATFVATGAVIALCAFFWSGLKVGDPTSESPILWPKSPYNKAMAAIQSEFGAIEQFVVVAELAKRESLNDPKLYHVMDEYERYMEGDPAVGRTFSVADLLSNGGSALQEFQPKWNVLPTTARGTGQLLGALLAGASPLSTAYIITPRREATQMTVYSKNREGENVQRIVLRTQKFFAEPQHQVTGVNFALAAGIIGELAAANQEIIDNDVLLNVLAFATIYIIILVTYRSFMAGLYLLFPLALANAAINAYMGAHDIGININTLPVVTVGVGFGIDYSIYIVSRIIEELALGYDLKVSTYTALVTSGKAVAFTALTLVASVLFWYWSSIRFDAEMGLLLAVWMFVSMLGAMTILPVLIVTFNPAFIRREKDRVIASRRPDLESRTVAASS
ncbi:MAG TPA: MMPL family transporter [Candidatus Acidoferrales bacterium]|nr:MMPL family transporter [Candidatus Acidoferrales bacterium]